MFLGNSFRDFWLTAGDNVNLAFLNSGVSSKLLQIKVAFEGNGRGQFSCYSLFA
jgi:hypothetical protein